MSFIRSPLWIATGYRLLLHRTGDFTTLSIDKNKLSKLNKLKKLTRRKIFTQRTFIDTTRRSFKKTDGIKYNPPGKAKIEGEENTHSLIIVITYIDTNIP